MPTRTLTLVAITAALLGACSPRSQDQANAAGQNAVTAAREAGDATATAVHDADRSIDRSTSRADAAARRADDAANRANAEMAQMGRDAAARSREAADRADRKAHAAYDAAQRQP